MSLAVKAYCSILFLLKLHLPFGNLHAPLVCYVFIPVCFSFGWRKWHWIYSAVWESLAVLCLQFFLSSDLSISGDHHCLFQRVCRIFFYNLYIQEQFVYIWKVDNTTRKYAFSFWIFICALLEIRGRDAYFFSLVIYLFYYCFIFRRQE